MSGPRAARRTVLGEALRVARVLELRPATAAELARLTGLQARTVYRVLADLRATGWAARGEKSDGPHRGAARARRWRFTGKGQGSEVQHGG